MRKSPGKNELRCCQRGQGMTEYINIVALIANGANFVVTILGENIRALFGTSANALTGEQSQLEGTTVTEEDIQRDLSNFGEEP
ncbi:MAG: hypothetical protein V3T05_04885 [Myxococcota bacterium]